MTSFDREAYQAAYDAHQRRLPKGHIITHVTWRNGHMTVESAPRLRPDPLGEIDKAKNEMHDRPPPRIRRGIQDQLL